MMKEFLQEKKDHEARGQPMYKFFKQGCPQYFEQLRALIGLPTSVQYEHDLLRYSQVYCKSFDIDGNAVSAKKIDVSQYTTPGFIPTS
jgi:hypothetical protein